MQREYLNRVTTLMLRPAGTTRADMRSLMRAQAVALLGRVDAASRRGGVTADTRAHLQDCADTLSQALQAKVVRPGL